jgi:hypothetical protein
MNTTFHIIQGCTFGLELVSGKDVDPNDEDWYLVFDLFLVRVVVNI